MSNPIQNGQGMVIREEKDFSVVFLRGIKKAAILWKKNYQINYNLGTVLNCHYQPIDYSSETLFAPFEICGPPPVVLNQINDVKVVGNRCLALYSFNLSAPVKEFKWWSKLSSQFVLKSEQLGYVFMDATVMDKSGKRQSPDVIAQYENNPNATRMVGYFEFARSCVPVACLDESGRGDTRCQSEEPEWVWTLKEILTTAKEYQEGTEDTKKANLGYDSRQMEQGGGQQWSGYQNYNQGPQYPQNQAQGSQYHQNYQNQGGHYQQPWSYENQNQGQGSQYQQGSYYGQGQSQYHHQNQCHQNQGFHQQQYFEPQHGQGSSSSSHWGHMDNLSGRMSNMSMGGSSRGPQSQDQCHGARYGPPSEPRGFNRDRQNYGPPQNQQQRQYQEDQWHGSQRSSRAPSEQSYGPWKSSRSTADTIRAKKEALRREVDEIEYQEVQEHMIQLEQSLGMLLKDSSLRRKMKIQCFEAFVDLEKFLEEYPKQARNLNAQQRR